MNRILFLLPVYNDALSLQRLVKELEKEAVSAEPAGYSILVIDDGSHLPITLHSSWPVTVLALHRNLGHQKAIAIGLSFACKEMDADLICVMDSDGEDQPGDAIALVEKSRETASILLAKRSSRKESRQFRFFYRLYQMLFRLLTGRKISFGNFMALPKAYAERLIYHSEIWSHLAGGLLRSELPFSLYPTHRGRRYEGRSQMNFHSLLFHGLGGISVFIDIIAARLLLFSITLIGGSFLAILLLFAIKFFTRLAIPGWTSTVVTSLMIVLLQSFLLSLFTIFLYLSAQTQRKFIPALHYQDFIRTIKTTSDE